MVEELISDEWDNLIEQIMNCRKCDLYKNRKNPVPGEGNKNADLMFIGEAPGAREDATGRPFVGAAGKLLTELIESIGLTRRDVYITNIVKCRPPGNRDPREEEINACLPYLLKQIKLIKPRIIVALGRHAGKTLFELSGLKWINMSRMHGRVFDASIEGVSFKLTVTYHPAAALYNPRLKGSLEKDFRETIKSLLDALRRRQEEVRQRTLFEYF